METSALRSHTAQIITVTVTSDRKLRYSRARVMLKYRSKEISVILRMEAVHNNTSVAEWTWKLWTWHQDSGRHLTLVNDLMDLNLHICTLWLHPSNVPNVLLSLNLWFFYRLNPKEDINPYNVVKNHHSSRLRLVLLPDTKTPQKASIPPLLVTD